VGEPLNRRRHFRRSARQRVVPALARRIQRGAAAKATPPVLTVRVIRDFAAMTARPYGELVAVVKPTEDGPSNDSGASRWFAAQRPPIERRRAALVDALMRPAMIEIAVVWRRERTSGSPPRPRNDVLLSPRRPKSWADPLARPLGLVRRRGRRWWQLEPAAGEIPRELIVPARRRRHADPDQVRAQGFIAPRQVVHPPRGLDHRLAGPRALRRPPRHACPPPNVSKTDPLVCARRDTRNGYERRNKGTSGPGGADD
jgi:hypothetical protein